MTVNDLPFNQNAEIAFIREGDLHNRLIEMGCVPGTQITKLYSAPGGDPIAFQVDDYILGLRKSEADYIQINPI
jgi:ferrous iron transport protein A